MRELIDGSTAIVRGALAAGCDFFAGYPITPASTILMSLMVELPRVGGVAVQGEDEIASIGMCIGAAMSGSRALTATSGPGLSLYSESIGLAVMGEVPLVIVDVQRLGPATGGATTIGQGDVQFVRWGTSGGFPIIALAPSSVAECYELTIEAFRLAERFRCPVFLLTDKELNLTLNTVEAGKAGPGTPPPRPGPEAPRGPEIRSVVPYRYEPADGVPPLVPYGGDATVRFTGSSHDERAFITKDPATVGALNRHLVAKIEEHRNEIERVALDLQPGARTLFVSYGTTAGAQREAVRRAREAGRAVSSAVVQSLWPVPATALGKAFEGIERIVVAELNLGQYRREIELLAQGRPVIGLHRMDGELLTPDQFLETLS
ncbi:MAG TPA: pyruvate flavodoxin/ferredoxin oxidoreductase [Acidobacteria bacterium]|nr:pyruvate flavodoxin/ferredoxin oxidoreductase [Acidobacteriota bacterium]